MTEVRPLEIRKACEAASVALFGELTPSDCWLSTVSVTLARPGDAEPVEYRWELET